MSHPAVNVTIEPPEWPPYPSDADDDYCPACDEHYQDFRPGITWDAGVETLRHASVSAGDPGGGFRTRGPVLWAMRALKLALWRERHGWCVAGEEV
jgi:hypothetical protein